MFQNLRNLAMAASSICTECSDNYEWEEYSREREGFATDQDRTMRGFYTTRWFVRGAIFINQNWESFEQSISPRDVPFILETWEEELPRDHALDAWAHSVSRRLYRRLCELRTADYDNYAWPLRRRNEQYRLAYTVGGHYAG